MSSYKYSKYDREHYILDIRDRIDQKAIKVLMGYYGDGPARKKMLGEYYEPVMERVNMVHRYLGDQGLLY